MELNQSSEARDNIELTVSLNFMVQLSSRSNVRKRIETIANNGAQITYVGNPIQAALEMRLGTIPAASRIAQPVNNAYDLFQVEPDGTLHSESYDQDIRRGLSSGYFEINEADSLVSVGRMLSNAEAYQRHSK